MSGRGPSRYSLPRNNTSAIRGKADEICWTTDAANRRIEPATPELIDEAIKDIDEYEIGER
jgi:hypothetical protein